MKRILLVIGIIISAAVWHLRLRFPFDDAFISFRYAEHVAAGYGFVWNIGGPHTEGFTNFLFVLVLALARLATTHLLTASQVIGLASTVVSGIAIFSIVSRLRGKTTGLLAVAFYWITPLTWVNALSGMETSLFIMWLLLALDSAGAFVPAPNLPGQKLDRYAPFIFATLATLTRPEGALIGVVIFAALFRRGTGGTSMTQESRRAVGGLLWSALFGFLLPLLLYAGWKDWYFGNLLPNSFYIKVSDSYGSAFPGMQYVRMFLVSTLVLIILTLGIRRWRHSSILIAGVWSLLLLAFYVFVLPLEGLYDRFLWPAFATLCITAAIGARDFTVWRRLRPFPVFSTIVLGMQLALSLLTPRTKQAFAAHEDIWDASMGPVIQALQLLPNFDSLHFAYGDAGYVVYKSGIHHIDLFGLNDTRIARARSAAERAAVVRSERPDILLLPVYSRDTCEAWAEDAYGLVRTDEFQPVASMGAFPFRLVWVLNRASPYYADCSRAIQGRVGVPGSGLDPAPPICYSTR